MRLMFVVVALSLLAPLQVAPAAQNGCGLKPLKPLTPLGCKDLVARCVCDANGANCKYEWVCVPR